MKFGTAFFQTKPVEKLLCIGISVGILIILVFFLAIGIVIYNSGRCHGTALTDTQLKQLMEALNQEPSDNSDRKIVGSCGKKNLAFQKKCGQSSYMDGYECGLAVDGNFSNYIHTKFFWKNNAYHGESNPNWWVDLESSCMIKLIKIYNRKDCCGTRFRNVEVTIGNSLSSMKVCGFYHGSAAKGEIISISCREPMVARYVKLAIKDQNTEEAILNFAEIQVFS
ncbi:fucolectin-like [Mytilus trossulus]|uniref:fucolectin-like n=1 Tax=Mytilus trossulus TaxID=6551 RepID=UPI0030059012